MLSYLTTSAPPPNFGPLAWIFFILQILAVAAGAYLYWLQRERNSARQSFVKQLGLALMILGGVGVLVGALRILAVPVFSQRLWFYIQLIVELGVAGYVAYYVRSVLPGLERSAASRPRSGGTRPGARAIATAEPAPATPRPVATTGRRDARRDRKRKNK